MSWDDKQDGDFEGHIVGTCEEMCPYKEITARERQRRLSKFEIKSGTEDWKQPKVDPQKAVKEYSRSAAGKMLDSSQLRTPSILCKTVDYLIQNFTDLMDTDPCDVYLFVTDRLRAVKQDLVIQRIEGKYGAEILEKSLRFYIFSQHKCHGAKYFNLKLHNDQIKDYVGILKGIYSTHESKYREEFEVYSLLLEINSDDAYRRTLSLPKNLKNSQQLRLALEIAYTYQERNYIRFFRLTSNLPFLSLCVLHRNIAEFRSQALNIMSAGYSNKVLTFPLGKLTSILAYEGETQAKTDCQNHGLEVSVKGVHFVKGKFVEPSEGNFTWTTMQNTVKDSNVNMLLGT